MKALDYRVFRLFVAGELRREDHVGNMWLDPKPERMEDAITPLRWAVDTTRGGTDKDGWWASGRSRTRKEAMDAFRNAWDSCQPKKSGASLKG